MRLSSLFTQQEAWEGGFVRPSLRYLWQRCSSQNVGCDCTPCREIHSLSPPNPECRWGARWLPHLPEKPQCKEGVNSRALCVVPLHHPLTLTPPNPKRRWGADTPPHLPEKPQCKEGVKVTCSALREHPVNAHPPETPQCEHAYLVGTPALRACLRASRRSRRCRRGCPCPGWRL